jgi:hypothetical protein
MVDGGMEGWRDGGMGSAVGWVVCVWVGEVSGERRVAAALVVVVVVL